MVLIEIAVLIGIGVLVWYAHRLHEGLARLLALLDAQDIDQRRCRIEDRRAGDVRQKVMEAFFRDTRGILGRVFALAEELSPHRRDTLEVPELPTPAPRSRPQSTARAPTLAAGLGRPRSVMPTLASVPMTLPPSHRSAPVVATRARCRACEGGIVLHPHGGIGRCAACGGLGEVDAGALPDGAA